MNRQLNIRHPVTNLVEDLNTMGIAARAELVQSILTDPDQAKLAKLALQLDASASELAHNLSAFSQPKTSFRFLWAGASAALALGFVIHLQSQNMNLPQLQTVALHSPVADHFGMVGSFEGATVNKSDRFSGGGFEAN
jgi:hypothetical protein